MNKNSTNQNNTQELTETTLKINLRTGAMHSNDYQEAQTQIDYTSYYIGSIFWFIRVAIEAESLLELQTDAKAYNDLQFRENIQFLAQIGEGLCEWLPNYGGLLRNKFKDQPSAAVNEEASLPIENAEVKNDVER